MIMIFLYTSMILLLFSITIKSNSNNELNNIYNFDSKNINILFNQTKKINKRAIFKNVTPKWIFPISYTVGDSINLQLIENVLNGIRQQTCLTFKKVRNFQGIGIKYVKGASCGIFSKNYTPVIIGIAQFCGKVGKIQKKTLNILGLLDEEDRPNRNNYVTINFQNVVDSVRFELNSRDPSMVNSYNLRYDYGSIMHNGKYYVSKNGKMTIVPKNKLYFNTIGQISQLGFNDMKTLNMYYCSSKCPKKLNCLNGGYTNPKNCSVCKCPRFFTGILCGQVFQYNDNCGNTILTATTTSKILNISGKKSCIFQITAPSGSKVQLTILSTKLPKRNPCPPIVGLEIKFLDDKSVSGATFCGVTKNVIIKSIDNSILLKYKGLFQDNNARFSYIKV
uniref:Metalloendopeptidase n=2 Tax=Strongyloides stercoralis TaxID=6248 RepID=A0A0K0DV45_STRER